MSILQVVEDCEEKSLEAPKGLLDRKYGASVLDRALETTREEFWSPRKLQPPAHLHLSIHLTRELSEAFGELWYKGSVVTEPSDLSFWTQVELPGYRDV